jgi:hypothetical protein
MDPTGYGGANTLRTGARPSSSLTSEAEKSSNAMDDYPFVCQTVISTGHTQNVFNAQMLPFSTRM